jgi:hypothetical protein
MSTTKKYKGGQLANVRSKLRKTRTNVDPDKWIEYKRQMDIYAEKNPVQFNNWLNEHLQIISENENIYKKTNPYEYKYIQLVTVANNSSSVGRRSILGFNNSSTISNNDAFSIRSNNSNVSTYEIFDLNKIETLPYNYSLIEKIKDIQMRFPDTYEAWNKKMKKSFDNAMVFGGPAGIDKWKKENPNAVKWFMSTDRSFKFYGGRKKVALKKKTFKKRKY